jgi:hypothetical protein
MIQKAEEEQSETIFALWSLETNKEIRLRFHDLYNLFDILSCGPAVAGNRGFVSACPALPGIFIVHLNRDRGLLQR